MATHTLRPSFPEINYRLEPEDQQLVIERCENYHTLFHDTFLNNFSIVCINSRHDKEMVIENKKKSLKKLNVACYNLQVFTKMCLDKIDELKEHLTFRLPLEELKSIENQWSKKIDAGNSFLTYDLAAELISEMRHINFPVDQLLNNEKYRVILQAFTRLYYHDKAFVKVSIFMPFKEARILLQEFIRIMSANPRLFYYIESIELAKELLPKNTVKIYTDASHPAFSIFFDCRIVSTNFHPAVAEVLSKIFPSIENTTEIKYDDIYSCPIGKNTTLSQGFRNYKKYLHLLGLIDEIYDKSSGYAFIK